MMRNKAMLFTVEVFIAASLVFITVFFLYSQPVEVPTFQDNTIKRSIFDCTRNMDLEGNLIKNVKNNNRTGVVTGLDSCINPNIGYNVTFCDPGCEDIRIPENKSVVSSSYYISGEENSYFPTKVIIYGWIK